MKMLRLLALFLVVAAFSLVGRAFSVDEGISLAPGVSALELVLDQPSQIPATGLIVSVSSGHGSALVTSQYAIDYATGNTFLADQEVFDTSVFTEPNASTLLINKNVIVDLPMALVVNGTEVDINIALVAYSIYTAHNTNYPGDVAFLARI